MHARARRAHNLMTGTRGHDKFHSADHILPAMPGFDFRKRVGADDEENIAVIGLHAFDRVNRVALSLALFEARCDEARVGGASQFHHAVALLKRRIGVFMRRVAGGDEEHAIKLKLIRRLARHFQMGGMDRIESSTENRGLHASAPRPICCSNSSSLSISMPIFNQ